MTTQTETIIWHLASAELPDAGTGVLMFVHAASEPVYPGYWDDEEQAWYYDSGMRVMETVTHWAEMPGGPNGTESRTVD